jgi:hypothetical protein
MSVITSTGSFSVLLYSAPQVSQMNPTDHPALISAERVQAQEDLGGVEGTNSALMRFLVCLAVAGGLFGLLLTSQATSGVAVLAFSILLSVIARIVPGERAPRCVDEAAQALTLTTRENDQSAGALERLTNAHG